MTNINFSFRNKLLLFWLGSVMSILVMVGVVYFYLHSTRLENLSLKRIGSSFSIFNAELEERKKLLLTKSRKLASSEDHVNVISISCRVLVVNRRFLGWSCNINLVRIFLNLSQCTY